MEKDKKGNQEEGQKGLEAKLSDEQMTYNFTKGVYDLIQGGKLGYAAFLLDNANKVLPEKYQNLDFSALNAEIYARCLQKADMLREKYPNSAKAVETIGESLKKDNKYFK